MMNVFGSTAGRRDFLKTALGSGLGLLVARSMASMSAATAAEPARKERIAVVGAGLAGLVAAGQLQARGYAVTVFEGRRRIGGRVWSADVQGQPVDLGAQWIVADAKNPVGQFCLQCGFKKVAHNEDSARVYDVDGTGFGDSEAEFLYAQAEKVIQQTQALNQQRIAAQQPDITMAEALRRADTKRPTTARQLRYRNWAIGEEVETAEAESGERLSLGTYGAEDEQESLENSRYLLPGGFAQVTARLAQGLDVRLGQPVTAVRWTADGVELVSEKETVRADRAIVTLPLGVLKAGTVQFSPELPAAKLQAIQAIGVGAVHKVVLRFQKQFWSNDEQLLGYASDTPGRFSEWWNYAELAGAPILALCSHGDAARRLEEGGAQTAVDEALRALRVVFRNAVTTPVASLTTSWSSNPFSRGAHVYLPLGATYAQLDTLAAPLENRVFFAGEATARQHPGTAHGAWLSGLREADRIGKLG